MPSAFVPTAAVPARCTSFLGSSVCARPVRANAPERRRARAVVAMSAANKKEDESIGDWLYRKLMHNALWEGDEEAGYEPFFKAAMTAREEEKKKAYEDMDKTK